MSEGRHAAAREAEAQGVRLIHSFLADRGYSRDGIPVQRGQPGALLHEPDHIASRIRQLLKIGKIDAVDGTPIDMPIQSILIHSDTPNSGAIADAVRKAVLDAGCLLRRTEWHPGQAPSDIGRVPGARIL